MFSMKTNSTLLVLKLNIGSLRCRDLELKTYLKKLENKSTIADLLNPDFPKVMI